jgi:hypothetical protein
VIVETVSNICVLHTAASAGLRWFHIVIPANGISALTDFDQALTLRQVSWLYHGSIVRSVEHIQFEASGVHACMEMVQSQTNDRAFAFLKVNERQTKPRTTRGVTEIRGPYHTPMGKRYLQDVLETMGVYVDTLKFAGGSFSLMPRERVKELIDLCHLQISYALSLPIHTLVSGMDSLEVLA